MSKRVTGAGSVPVNQRFDITAGCDVDKNFVVVGLYHHQRPTIQTREFTQDRIGVSAAVEWVLAEGVELAVIESTANYHMLFYDAFRQHGINIHVINPLIVKSLLRVEGKSDKGDAATLARLAASFDLRTSNMPDQQQRMIRLHLRDLDKAKGERTRVLNRTVGILTQAGITTFRLIGLNSVSGLGFCEGIYKGMGPQMIVDTYWRGKKDKAKELVVSIPTEIPEYIRSWLVVQWTDIKRLNERIDFIEDQALAYIEKLNLAPQIAWMSTAPAITLLLALRFIAEMGQNYWERYESADACAKAVGVVPSNEVSGGKLLKRKTTHGNSYIKQHLLNSVKSWVLHAPAESELKQFYSSYRTRATYGKAISAVARKIVEALWWMARRRCIS